MHSRDYAYVVGKVTRHGDGWFIVDEEGSGNRFKIFTNSELPPLGEIGLKYIRNSAGQRQLHSITDPKSIQAMLRHRRIKTKRLVAYRNDKN